MVADYEYDHNQYDKYFEEYNCDYKQASRDWDQTNNSLQNAENIRIANMIDHYHDYEHIVIGIDQ